MAIECEHGQLKRRCLLCEYEERIAKLEVENEKLRKLLHNKINYIREDSGALRLTEEEFKRWLEQALLEDK